MEKILTRFAGDLLGRLTGPLTMTMGLIACLGIGLNDARAQDKPKEPPKLGWSNSADLSLVLTAGNSAAQTWGFTNQARHVWKDARLRSR